MKIRRWAAGVAALTVGGLIPVTAVPAHAQDPPVVDLAVSATSAHGTVGEVVEVVLTVANHGPDPGNPLLRIGRPDYTVIVGLAGDLDPGHPANTCFDTFEGEGVEWTESHQLECTWDDALPAGERRELTMSVRIDDAIDSEGWLEVDDEYLCCADPNLDNNHTPIVITSEGSAVRVADLAIAATEASGEVGEVVEVVVTVSNLGPDTGAPVFQILAPTGTVAVAAGEELVVGGCSDPDYAGEDPTQWSDAAELRCSWQSVITPDVELSMTIAFRIDSVDVGDDGLAVLHEMADNDPDLSNNTAPIVIAALGQGDGGEAGGQLPVTGAQAGLLAAGGLSVLVAGGALYLAARRRRVVLAVPEN